MACFDYTASLFRARGAEPVPIPGAIAGRVIRRCPQSTND
ncbi:hypothetical protein HRUBRA_02228 [Pseudohaliea rubra DSM 19751]|uniref:Uncharacterized protein n=1 Tax=Pseudohaliea rubra DSM 19751 TaxID=1265313 RepID=A0A095VQ12_9GAMM|nr:hypothetical protein HRUBRA_02228 [Pseudohaliea rubra DSM 19751]